MRYPLGASLFVFFVRLIDPPSERRRAARKASIARHFARRPTSSPRIDDIFPRDGKTEEGSFRVTDPAEERVCAEYRAVYFFRGYTRLVVYRSRVNLYEVRGSLWPRRGYAVAISRRNRLGRR